MLSLVYYSRDWSGVHTWSDKYKLKNMGVGGTAPRYGLQGATSLTSFRGRAPDGGLGSWGNTPKIKQIFITETDMHFLIKISLWHHDDVIVGYAL